VIGYSQSHRIKSRKNNSVKQRDKRFKASDHMKPKTKKAPPYFYEGPALSKDEREEETDDIYNDQEREEMLDDDEITAAEAGFMLGREDEPPSKKETRKNAISHTDETSDELAKEDAEDD
jgi:hypothetical protein